VEILKKDLLKKFEELPLIPGKVRLRYWQWLALQKAKPRSYKRRAQRSK
jgi:hypothetical protein